MSDRLSCFAIDPGGTTGWALVTVPVRNLLDRQVNLLTDMEFDCGQIVGPENEQAWEIGGMLWSFRGPVIIEDFILRQFRQDADLLAPVRVMEKVDYEIFCANMQRKKTSQLQIKKQQPSLAKSTATDDRLKEWGLWVPGQPHARDSLRHSVTFLRRAKVDRKLLLWAWPEFK